ncbi:MAG: permease-like cell division protein FtsX [Rikenellaceae bacterium]|jgi:cell division transport system permease protein|nr:permease-like cell division protein FtsX [Rikenellaceae bacterium]
MSKENNKELRRKIRTSYAISTTSIALVLFLLGTVGYLILNAISATDRMKESVTVNVMLKDNLKEGYAGVGNRIKAQPQVREAIYVSREQAADEFKQYVGTDFEKFLGENPLPDSYRVRMKPSGSDRASLEEFEKTAMTWPEVDEVVYQRTVIDQITSNIRRFVLVLILFGGTFLVIAVVLLNNTIRAAIYSKRYIINTMKLVGATRGFILRPFMKGSVVQGIYAALVAAVMFMLMIVGLHEGMPQMTLIVENRDLGVILGAMLVGGIVISLLFTTFAVNKFINMKTNQIYMY